MTTETTLLEPGAGADTPRRGLYLLAMSQDSFVTRPIDVGEEVTIGRAGSTSLRLEDPLCSRLHAKIVVAETITVLDLGSVNGTKVRGVRIEPNTPVQVAETEAIQIGSTVLIVQRDQGDLGARRMWSHNYFESRLAQQCEKATRTGTQPAVLRIRLEASAGWNQLMPILVAELAPPHLLAAYGPAEYQALLIDVTQKSAERLMRTIERRAASVGAAVRLGLACFPRDGRSVSALVSHAGQQVRPAPSSAPEVDLPRSPALQEVYSVAERAAASNINLLILGETGVGKEVMTKHIHRLSPRSSRALVCINCAGFQETLLESELFGYERGAFTGANLAKPGLLETADGGTLLLDEVGEMSLALQAKLLRVLEAREVMRVGALKPRAIDVRFIAATNRNLQQEVALGRFREDLFFRLNGISLYIPPLRERASEIDALANKFIADASRADPRSKPIKISDQAIALLRSYYWPGNIRELKNVIERALVLCTGPEITVDHLASERIRSPVNQGSGGIGSRQSERVTPASGTNHSDALEAAVAEQLNLNEQEVKERARIIRVLHECAWNQTRAAQLLGMPRRTLVFKLRAFGIPRPQQKPAGAQSSDGH